MTKKDRKKLDEVCEALDRPIDMLSILENDINSALHRAIQHVMQSEDFKKHIDEEAAKIMIDKLTGKNVNNKKSSVVRRTKQNQISV